MTLVWTIVVGAGAGTRFGGPKQVQPCAGRRVIDWAAAAAADSSDGVVLVLPSALIDSDGTFETDRGRLPAVAGGATRSASVRSGLAIANGADASIPVVPVADTIRRRNGGFVDRSELVAVQTPQGFRAAALRAAHSSDAEATDDASLVEAAGGRVELVEGSPTNLKITTPIDLATADAALRERAGSTHLIDNAQELS